MTDEELLAHQRYLDAQNELKRFDFTMKMICLICFGMFLFGMVGLLLLRAIS